MADVSGALDDLEKVPTEKIAGIPVWGWIGIAFVGVAGVLVVRHLASGAAGSASGGGGFSLPGGVPSLFGGGGGSPAPAPSPADPTATIEPGTNADWLTNAVGKVAQVTGIDAYRVQAYLQGYLNGVQPFGGGNAFGDYEKAISNALSLSGKPPQGVSAPSPGSTLFGTPQQWIAAGLSELQALSQPVSNNVRNELQALLSGQSTTVSPDAYKALQSIESFFGAFPGLNYSVVTPAAPVAPTLASDTAQKLVDLYHQLQGQNKLTDPLSQVWQDIFSSQGVSNEATAYVKSKADQYTAGTKQAATTGQLQQWLAEWFTANNPNKLATNP